MVRHVAVRRVIVQRRGGGSSVGVRPLCEPSSGVSGLSLANPAQRRLPRCQVRGRPSLAQAAPAVRGPCEWHVLGGRLRVGVVSGSGWSAGRVIGSSGDRLRAGSSEAWPDRLRPLPDRQGLAGSSECLAESSGCLAESSEGLAGSSEGLAGSSEGLGGWVAGWPAHLSAGSGGHHLRDERSSCSPYAVLHISVQWPSASRAGAVTLCFTSGSSGPLLHGLEQWLFASPAGAVALCFTGRSSGSLLHQRAQGAVASRCGARHRAAGGCCRAAAGWVGWPWW